MFFSVGKLIQVCIIALILFANFVSTVFAVGEGKINFFRKADSGFDSSGASSTGQAFANSHFEGMLMYYPHADAYKWWSNGPGFFYRNAFGLTVTGDDSGLGLSQVIKSSNNQPCYLPDRFRYVGDVGSSTFRTQMIDSILSRLHSSNYPQYDGVYLDDVNLGMNETIVCDGGAPIDPRTGQPMTETNWKKYLVEYLEQLRAATNEKIIHNTVWYDQPYSDPYRIRELKATDYVEIEFGFVDNGQTGDNGKWSWQQKMAWIDLVHNNGANIIQQEYWHANTLTSAEIRFGIGNYLLYNDGQDYWETFQSALPSNWDNAYDSDIGNATGPRYIWQNNLWRRDFTNGFVIVNYNGQSTKTVNLGGNYTDLWGRNLSSVSLTARDAIVIKTSGVIAPTPTRTPTPTPTPTISFNPADIDRSGKVDIRDFNLWRIVFIADTYKTSYLDDQGKRYYPNVTTPSTGKVSILDFNAWRIEFIKLNQ